MSTTAGSSGSSWIDIDSEVKVTSTSGWRTPYCQASACIVATTSAAPAPEESRTSPTRRQKSMVRLSSRASIRSAAMAAMVAAGW